MAVYSFSFVLFEVRLGEQGHCYQWGVYSLSQPILKWESWGLTQDPATFLVVVEAKGHPGRLQLS